jgi:hypothetical protein
MNSATVNLCPDCGQMPCGCRPAGVPARRRGPGRPPQAKNNVYVNDEGERVPAHLYKAEVKMKQKVAKAEEKQRVATAAAADAERAAAESHKSPAKAREADAKTARAAKAEEDAAAAWEKVAAAKKEFKKSNEKILARVAKAKKVRSTANPAPLDQVPPAVQPTPQAAVLGWQPAPQLDGLGFQPPPQPGFFGWQPVLSGQLSSCPPLGQLSLLPQWLSYQPPPDRYLVPSPQVPWQPPPNVQPNPPEYGASHWEQLFQSKLEGSESLLWK